jgi:hypothetical protein
MKQLTLNPQANSNPLKRDTEGYNLMNNSSKLLCTKGYMSSQDFRHYLEDNNLVTPQRILRYSLVLDNLHVFPLCLEEMLDSKAIYKDYPYAFRASSHHKQHLLNSSIYIDVNNKDVLIPFYTKIAMDLNKGIKILKGDNTVLLSKLHTINSVMVYNTPTVFMPNTIIHTTILTEDKEVKGLEVKSKALSSTNTSEFDDNVLMSRQLGNLQPMHTAYFEDKEGDIVTHSKEDIDTNSTDTAYWNSILSKEGLSTHFDGIVANAMFNGEECSTFEEGKDITQEDRQEYIKEVQSKRNNMLRNAKKRIQRKKAKANKPKASMNINDYL